MHEKPERHETALEPRRVNVFPVEGNYPRRAFPWLSVVVFLVGGAIGIGALLAWQARNTNSIAPVLDAQAVREKEKQIEHETVIARQNEKIATSRARLEALIAEGKGALEQVALFEKELVAWETSIVPLLNDERGRFLAADEACLSAFKAIYNKRRPSQADGASLRRRIETLVSPLELALSAEGTAYTPSEDIRASIERERKAAEALIPAYHEPRTQIEGMIANASQTHTRASLTLEEAIRALDARHAAEQARKIAEAQETERKKADAAISSAKAAQVAQEAKNQVVQIEAKTVADQKRADLEAEKTIDAAERERVKKAAQSADVAKALAPFVSEGYWQPGRRPDQCTEKGPVSFSALQSSGALQDTPRGLQQLLTAGTALPNGRLQDKVRPRWGYPTQVARLSPAQLEALKTAQRYLRDFGPTLVELKVLAP